MTGKFLAWHLKNLFFFRSFIVINFEILCVWFTMNYILCMKCDRVAWVSLFSPYGYPTLCVEDFPFLHECLWNLYWESIDCIHVGLIQNFVWFHQPICLSVLQYHAILITLALITALFQGGCGCSVLCISKNLRIRSVSFEKFCFVLFSFFSLIYNLHVIRCTQLEVYSSL